MVGQVHTWRHEGRNITFTWLGESDVIPNRVYALAITASGNMLLVREVGGNEWLLPGGGVEAGESAADALRRELLEEAAADILALSYLGTQQAFDPLYGESFQAFYWARVSLAEAYTPQLEIAERRLVGPEAFLNLLFWGRRDPKGEMLLTRALELNEAMSAGLKRR